MASTLIEAATKARIRCKHNMIWLEKKFEIMVKTLEREEEEEKGNENNRRINCDFKLSSMNYSVSS